MMNESLIQKDAELGLLSQICSCWYDFADQLWANLTDAGSRQSKLIYPHTRNPEDNEKSAYSFFVCESTIWKTLSFAQ